MTLFLFPVQNACFHPSNRPPIVFIVKYRCLLQSWEVKLAIPDSQRQSVLVGLVTETWLTHENRAQGGSYNLHQIMQASNYDQCCAAEINCFGNGTILFKKFSYWSIVALQCCVHFCCTAEWISCMYTYIPSFFWFPPHLVTTEHWVELPVLYSRFSRFPGRASGKEPTWNAGGIKDAGSLSGWGRCPGGGHGNPLHYSCLENPMDRGAWVVMTHRVAKVRHDWNDSACRHTLVSYMCVWCCSEWYVCYFFF